MRRFADQALGPTPHIAVLSSGKVGNFVVLTPLLRGLKEKYPACALDYFGSDITAEAADAVVMETSLGKVDELMHIGRRMRTIALQSAIGGMALSVIGMGIAAAGRLTPVAGAIAQEVIDVAVVLNALRATLPAKDLRDEGI